MGARLGWAVAVLIGLGAVGCGSDPGTPGDEADLVAAPVTHAAAVDACAAEHAPEDAGAAELDAYAACLADANDDVLGIVAARAAEVDAALADEAEARFDAYRQRFDSVCGVFAAGADDMEAVCSAAAERTLADLLDAYADLDQPARPLADGRADHPSCYAAFDAAKPTYEIEIRGATFELALCIEADLEARATPLATHAGVAVETVTDALGAAHDAALDACALLAAASEGRGGTLARLDEVSCRVDVANRTDALARAILDAPADGG